MREFEVWLAEIRRAGLYRKPVEYEPLDAVHVRAEGKVYLMLSSNNYLGLTHHDAVRLAAAEAALRYGTGSGGSRLTSGTHPLFQNLESDIAVFKGTEAALIFNTGYMANVGAVAALAGPEDAVFSDELNHASIIDGCRLSRAKTFVYRHADMDHLAEGLSRAACRGRKLIVTDGVFSMDGDIAPLDKIIELAEKYNAMVMVDDAHATGVIGPGGRGTAAYFGLEDKVHVTVGTLSKSLASEGGFVAGGGKLIEFLTNRARSFIFSTALSPATVGAARAALAVLTENPGLTAKLAENAAFLSHRLREAGFRAGEGQTPIIPVVVGEAATAVKLMEELRRQGLIISAVRPPTVPPGTSRLRITVSAAHSRQELDMAADVIVAAGKKLGLI